MIRDSLLYLLIVAFFLSGCGTQEVCLSKGRFSFPVAHSFTGVAKELPENSSIDNGTVSLAYVPDASLRVSGVRNYGATIDFVYSLNRFPLMVSYMHLWKRQTAVFGFGFGGGRYIYGRFLAGLNQKHFEWGGYFDLGYSFDRGSYEYSFYESSGLGLGGEEFSHYGDSTYSEKYIPHLTLAFGGYISYYNGAFGVTYAPSLYAPWCRSDLPINAFNSGNYDISFSFPIILSQYVGISFWLTEHWKIAGGATFLIPQSFDGLAITANTSISFWI